MDDKIILAIDTSCDETSAAVTQGMKILSNIVWSQATQHAKFGGVMPSLAQRMHEERIDWVIERAITKSQVPRNKIGAIAVTAGPGLAIALGVGIRKAKELANEWQIPLLEINHLEGHVLSALVGEVTFPAVGLVVSGGHTELINIEKIGKYKIIAATQDDALGEALDKAARMLGLGYPGGAFLEKLANEGNPKAYPLPLPMAGREDKNSFSYSGLKTAFWRMTDSKQLNKQDTADMAASFQDMAFKHLTRVIATSIKNSPFPLLNLRGGSEGALLVGGGVSANVELRKRLRLLGKELGFRVHFPMNKKLCGDNAGMIGMAAGFKYQRGEYLAGENVEKADRKPRWKIDDVKYGSGNNL